MCWSFTKGDIGPGVHIGVVTGAPGAWAELMAAHDSMLHPVPDDISDSAAVLADPFSVSFHAIVRHPHRPAARSSCSAPGPWGSPAWPSSPPSIPDVEVAVVARFPAQVEMARQFGASVVVAHEPRLALVEALAEWSGGVLHQAFDGLPMTHPGHIDVVYDTVGQAGDLRGRGAGPGRAGQARLHRRGRPGPVGVDARLLQGAHRRRLQRLRQEEFEGHRRHAIDHYLDLVRDGRIDLDRHGHPPLRPRGLVGCARRPCPARSRAAC